MSKEATPQTRYDVKKILNVFVIFLSLVSLCPVSCELTIRSLFNHIPIREACQDMVLSDEQLKEISTRLLKSINEGLDKNSHDSAAVKCFVTYVQDLPNGKERGKFLALDLGGTNFRVLLITLDENHFDMKSKIYAIPQSIMIGPGAQLFDHIAECLINFMKDQGVSNERLPLGFTFSFPLRQLGLTKGLLSQWTKGFNCSGVVGEDVVQKLKEALERRGDRTIDPCAILNDTTGTLMSCAWKNINTRIGIIVGTGCNACYVEKVENVDLFDGDKSKPYVIINTEWGNFGADGALDDILTEYDREIDEKSLNPGKQIFEKIISGMYMGEIVRLMLVKFTKQKLLFNGQGSEKLSTKGSFLTKYVSDIENDVADSHVKCREVFAELDLSHASDQDCVNVRYICEIVSRRAAHLVSAGAATLINKMDFNSVTIGVDGSVYRFHPQFHHLMVEKISQMIRPKVKFDIMLSEDGSGRGAALVAAVASR
ncbi:hexokinase type 2 isoform X1 [Planococcus citri]|uniref:hexokinase type 2 isoform X1 n=1 Tax=Planococcus citri TaxID=170843 RepID=UPI0031F78013